MLEQEVNQLVGHLFRHEAGRMAAVLTRLLGFQQLDLAQDIVQDSLLKAMNVWKYKGIPENPSAWLYTVAKRKAIDWLRQQKLHQNIHTEIGLALQSEWTLSPTVNQLFLENEIEDSQLRMIFACCHPSIPYESQIALTLKTLCGLSISEIAQSFLTNEETITKRLYRAREKIREEKISLESPAPATLPGRLDAVLHTIYLLFNEGYNSSHPDQLIRTELCEEAIRLCLLLTRNTLTDLPKTRALLALMCFQASRGDSRLNNDGNIILLKDQDRSQWNRELIAKGKYYLELAAEGDTVTEYHLEAMIASCHADAMSFENTNWKIIYGLYTALLEIKNSPIVEMNKAIVLGYLDSFQSGLEALKKIKGLDQNHLFHSALGDFYFEVGNKKDARHHYHQAEQLTHSNTDKQLLHYKIKMAANL
ncbi:MAG: sigma-70 family RNA polymerase sigma factor [Chryseolinea sp.]